MNEMRTIEVCQQYTDTPYLDSIRLFDYEAHDYGLPEPVYFRGSEIGITSRKHPDYNKERFLESLTLEQLKEVLQHFKQYCDSTNLGETEYKLTYLAWLLGEKHLLTRCGFLLYDPEVVDIFLQNYNGLPYGVKLGIPDFEQLKQHYYLDLLYETVFG